VILRENDWISPVPVLYDATVLEIVEVVESLMILVKSLIPVSNSNPVNAHVEPLDAVKFITGNFIPILVCGTFAVYVCPLNVHDFGGGGGGGAASGATGAV